MSNLYINDKYATLSIDGGYFVVKYKDGLLRKIPKETLESITLFGNVSITTPCMKYLLTKGITVSYFSEKGSYYGRLESTVHKNIQRVKKQIYLSDDLEFCLELSKRIIEAKINNQIIILSRYQKDTEIMEEITKIKYLKNKINGCNTVDELTGYEGSCAKLYFKAISNIIDIDFAFNGRNRMPPKDPFNSLISLGYTLLMYEIYGAIENKSLSPYSGFLHKDHERHPTLASDLMEEWRAVIINSLVLSLIQGKEILITHFIKDEETGGVYLTNDGMKIFIKKMKIK